VGDIIEEGPGGIWEAGGVEHVGVMCVHRCLGGGCTSMAESCAYVSCTGAGA